MRIFYLFVFIYIYKYENKLYGPSSDLVLSDTPLMPAEPGANAVTVHVAELLGTSEKDEGRLYKKGFFSVKLRLLV